VAQDLPEPRQVVSGHITEGLALLAGKPKSGKSHLALQWAINVAAGEPTVGGYKTERCSVLYLDLEQSLRSIRARLVAILSGNDPPANLWFAHEWPRLGQGGVEEFGVWFEREPGTRLIIVDTAARLWPAKQEARVNAYYWEYDLLSRIKTFAQDRNAAVLLLHHENKGGQADRIDRVSGTGAMTGVPDSIMILERTALDTGTLYITGREVEQKEMLMRFRGRKWEKIGEAEQARAEEKKQRSKWAKEF
jgi:RecA-family ATPase